MMLTTKGQYAVMALVDLAKYSNGQPVKLAAISQRQNIAINYLEQIFVRLRRQELVSSVKGPGGGYKLNNNAANITIAQIIEAVDEQIQITRCSKKKQTACVSNVKCLTHDLWDGLTNRIIDYFTNITINDVCNNNLLGSKS